MLPEIFERRIKAKILEILLNIMKSVLIVKKFLSSTVIIRSLLFFFFSVFYLLIITQLDWQNKTGTIIVQLEDVKIKYVTKFCRAIFLIIAIS